MIGFPIKSEWTIELAARGLRGIFKWDCPKKLGTKNLNKYRRKFGFLRNMKIFKICSFNCKLQYFSFLIYLDFTDVELFLEYFISLYNIITYDWV
jgi:hypothetical protein